MNQNFRGYKQEIRSFMQDNYTDSRLAELLAHAQDGKLAFESCCCFIGVCTADHELHGEGSSSSDHYIVAKDLDKPRYYPGSDYPAYMGRAEYAYFQLAYKDDTKRQRILVPMIRAEMKRRDRARAICPETVHNLVPVEVA